MISKESTLYFNHAQFKFSVAHFTIFSKTEREPLHGHNYTVEITLTAKIQEPGITFDYRLFEEKIMILCKQLNWRCLIPQHSPYLQIINDGPHYQITFNHESMWLLKSDVILLPLENITLETLSEWFCTQLQNDKTTLEKFCITQIAVKVFNGPYHAAQSVNAGTM